MTMEVILSTAFGRAVDVQGGKGGKLFESALAVFSALTPAKENDPINVFRILQFLLCKLIVFYCVMSAGCLKIAYCASKILWHLLVLHEPHTLAKRFQIDVVTN